MILTVFAKAIAIAICAAMMAAICFVAVSFYAEAQRAGLDFSLPTLGGSFVIALAGSFSIGLPVSLLTFFLSWRHLVRSATTLAMIAVLAGIMMILASYAIGDATGVRMLGIPAFVAALTYGILGWFWILKPLQNTLNSPPQEKETA